MHIIDHWFWFLLTVACVAWYSTITVYVAIRGAFDIKGMLARLSDKQKREAGPDSSTSGPGAASAGRK
jgi:hypothetical protein